MKTEVLSRRIQLYLYSQPYVEHSTYVPRAVYNINRMLKINTASGLWVARVSPYLEHGPHLQGVSKEMDLRPRGRALSAAL